MNIPKIADAIGYIDNELITATLEAPPKKRHNPVMKWMTAAACLTLFVIAGILIPHLLKNDATAESKYKYHVSETERAIEWPWKYKTPAEKYPVVKFNGKQFTAKSQNSIHTEVMGEVIGNCVAEGLDSDTGKAYTETFEVRKIKGISEELMIAVGGGTHRSTQAALFIRAAATILDNESAIGFLDCDVLREPVHFRKTALALREQALATPILFWIGLSRLPEGADGLPRLKAWTNGLARFDKLEMEIPSTAADIHDAFILLNSAACYVLDHDAQMQPGEALEWKDGEVPLSLGKSSAIDEDQDVLIVDLDGLRPRGDGVVENKDEGEA